LVDRLQAGDMLVVTGLGRLACSTRDLLNVLESVKQAGAGFRSLKDDWADTATPHGRSSSARGSAPVPVKAGSVPRCEACASRDRRSSHPINGGKPSSGSMREGLGRRPPAGLGWTERLCIV
jgi:hypothetical protein